MLLVPKLIYKFNAILIKTPIPTSSFSQLGKFLNLIGENKHIRVFRKTLKQKKYERRLTLPDNRAHSKASMIKVVWYWCMNRQNNETE